MKSVKKTKPSLCYSNSNLKASTESKESQDLNQSNIEKLDSQIGLMFQDVTKLSNDVKLILALIKSMSKIKSAKAQSTIQKAPENLEKSVNFSSDNIEKVKISSQICLNYEPFKVTSSTQTDRFLLDELISKLTDAGSPPPNSGYSSSSSNEDKVRFLTNLYSNRAEDSENVGDENVSKNSQIIQNVNSNKDGFPLKIPEKNWNFSFCDNASILLPKTSGLQPPSNIVSQPENQFTINMENNASTSNLDVKKKLSTEL